MRPETQDGLPAVGVVVDVIAVEVIGIEMRPGDTCAHIVTGGWIDGLRPRLSGQDQQGSCNCSGNDLHEVLLGFQHTAGSVRKRGYRGCRSSPRIAVSGRS